MITKSKLQRLSEDCSKLLYYSENLESSNFEELMEVNGEIKRALRKIIIANEISDRMIVCITGLQGTGKTTLMKNFYDLDDNVMNVALGRGERLPVFITEKADVHKAEMYAVGIKKEDGGYVSVRERVTQSEFIEYSRAEDEDTAIMYMEILVPKKYLCTSTKLSYMLLPGYERKDDYWNTLIDFSVQCSDTAIFVLTPSSISGAANESLMEKVKEKFGNNLIYVITHSDEKNDENKECKETLGKVLGISGDNIDRIICTGSYMEVEKNDNWKKQLKKAIERYSANPEFVDQKNLEFIDKIIINELRPAVIKIKKYVTDITDKLISDYKNSAWLEEFDKAAKNMRKQYDKRITDKFKEQESSSEIRLKNIMNSSSKIGNLKRNIFGESLKDIEMSQHIIDDAMKDESGNYSYQNAFSVAVVECTDLICSKNNNQISEKSTLLIEAGKNKTTTLLATKDAEEVKLILQDVGTILSDTTKKDMLVYKDPVQTMRAIVECGTQYFGLVAVDELNSVQYIEVPELAKSGLTKENIRENIQSTEKFALGVLGVTGLDLLGDGVVNIIPKLASALGVAVPVAKGIVGACVGFGAVTSIAKDYNRMQVSDYYSYRKAISSVYDEIKKDYLDIYDTYIGKIRDRVEQYLIHCSGDNMAVLNKQNAIIAINNIRTDLEEISRDLKNDSYELTNLIKG